MNIAYYLSDPPKGFETCKSMIVGLNTCKLAHSLWENLVICKDWIRDFWYKSTAKKGDKVIKS
ncbi:putative aminopeptidase, leukotriene A4 hydrolase [Helianthus anomalus]